MVLEWWIVPLSVRLIVCVHFHKNPLSLQPLMFAKSAGFCGRELLDLGFSVPVRKFWNCARTFLAKVAWMGSCCPVFKIWIFMVTIFEWWCFLSLFAFVFCSNGVKWRSGGRGKSRRGLWTLPHVAGRRAATITERSMPNQRTHLSSLPDILLWTAECTALLQLADDTLTWFTDYHNGRFVADETGVGEWRCWL